MKKQLLVLTFLALPIWATSIIGPGYDLYDGTDRTVVINKSAAQLQAEAEVIYNSAGFAAMTADQQEQVRAWLTVEHFPDARSAQRDLGDFISDNNYESQSAQDQTDLLITYFRGYKSGLRARFDMSQYPQVEYLLEGPVDITYHPDFGIDYNGPGFEYRMTFNNHLVRIQSFSEEWDVYERIAEAISFFPFGQLELLELVHYQPQDGGTWYGNTNRVYICTRNPGDIPQMQSIFAHEMGHGTHMTFRLDRDWEAVLSLDIAQVSSYGNTNRAEDFAEYNRLMYLYMQNTDMLGDISNIFPNRFAFYKVEVIQRLDLPFLLPDASTIAPNVSKKQQVKANIVAGYITFFIPLRKNGGLVPVSIALFNTQGRKISQVLSGAYGSGWHTQNIANTLYRNGNGMYIIRIQTGTEKTAIPAFIRK
ncbi:MAG: hypothetical protein JW768_07065 [Chitinispirillaceae bacterium]|nr:hypothetical protein [Chitinispirillaceae bacterium]